MGFTPFEVTSEVSNQDAENTHLDQMRHIQGFFMVHSTSSCQPMMVVVSYFGRVGQSLKTEVKQKSQGNAGQDSDLNPELTQRAPKSSQKTLLIKASWPAQHWA